MFNISFQRNPSLYTEIYGDIKNLMHGRELNMFKSCLPPCQTMDVKVKGYNSMITRTKTPIDTK